MLPATLLSLLLPAVASLALSAAPPVAPKKPVADTYHGITVTDDYRWLEDWSDPAVKAWSEAQNTHARSLLDALPSVAPIRERLTTLMGSDGVDLSHLQVRAGRTFALRHDPAKQQPTLVELRGLGDEPSDIATVVVDPNSRDATGLTTIDWFEISPDGKLAAVSLSEGGSESGTLHVFAVDANCETGDVIPRVHGGTAGGSLAWRPDNAGFYYTRYPRAGERPEADMDFFVHVYSHTIGDDPAKDTYEIGKDFPRIAEIVLETDSIGRVLASVQNGDGGEFAHFIRDHRSALWNQLTRFEDGYKHAILGTPGTLFLVCRKDAPRGKVVRCWIENQLGVLMPNGDTIPPKITARFEDLLPVSRDGASIETDFFEKTGLLFNQGILYVWYQIGGPNEVRAFDLSRAGTVWSKLVGKLPAPPISTIGQLVPDAHGSLLYQTQSFISPPSWCIVIPNQIEQRPRESVIFQKTSTANYSDCEVVREFATSKDGTKVPLSIIRKKALGLAVDNGLTPNDGSPRLLKADQPGQGGLPGWSLPAPTILWGYGGYGVNESPSFSARRRLFLEQGGVFVVANIRGGGEYGEEWHLSGNLTKKQNVFDDYFAAARHLITRGYTDKDHLCLMGGSNGGLLMGATFTQHPDLCKCVVSSVGIYDMLRVELSPNGAFNIPEFGTVKDKAQFDALYAYSPYHHVKDATTYPSILFLTGANDPRVDPMQSRKMTARLQAASPATTTLLRTSASSGHGIGSSLAQRIEENVDVYAFIFKHLGVNYQPVK